MKIEQRIKVAVDAVVFGYQNQQLKVLLIKQKFGITKGEWAIVGGFVKDNEGLLDAVKRELNEETGVNISHLEQLYTFGDNVNRDPRAHVISVTYFALVNSFGLTPKASTDAEECEWFNVNELPELAYDHQLIISVALQRLKLKLRYEPIGFDLLPNRFIFSELENLYTTILGVQIDRRNFRKKILSYNILTETDEIVKKGSGRPAKYFEFNLNRYRELQQKGIYLEFN